VLGMRLNRHANSFPGNHVCRHDETIASRYIYRNLLYALLRRSRLGLTMPDGRMYSNVATKGTKSHKRTFYLGRRKVMAPASPGPVSAAAHCGHFVDNSDAS
jgi:hypothetical protein